MDETLPTTPPPGRAFDDPAAFRTSLYDATHAAVSATQPVTVGNYSLGLSNVAYEDPPEVTPTERKKAVLRNETLARRLRGDLTLTDNKLGVPVTSKRVTIARVPKPTDDGTMVLNGVEWTLGSQFRLKPGVFVRRTHAGDVEAHANVAQGTGPVHHYYVDPKSGVFKLRVGQSSVNLLPLLRHMGATNDQLEQAWGADVLAANNSAKDAGSIQKLFDRIVRPRPGQVHSNPHEAVVKAFQAMQFDPTVNKRTLSHGHAGASVDAILAATKKIVAVRKGEAEPDDRDAPMYQRMLGPEDLIAERVRQLPGALRKLAFKAGLRGNLEHVPADFFGPNLLAAITGSGLGQPLDETNPAEMLGQLTRVSRLGTGGISSASTAPEESKAVQPSQYGIVDGIFSPESEKAGLDMRLAAGARKGPNGEIFTRVRNARTGKIEWVTADHLADKTRAFALEDLKAGQVRALVKNRLDYANGRDVDYETVHSEDAYNPLLQLVPFKGGMKGGRQSMAARMMTQAVPMTSPEAPLVQVEDPDDPTGSMEKRHGVRMGAIRATQPGEVVDVSEDAVKVKGADGKVTTHWLAKNQPYNRKTNLTQTPRVQIGQTVKPGDLIAHSNFTDKDGVTALGTNLRTAFMPAKGYSFEDAFVVSESAANHKLKSNHAYQHSVDFDHGIKNQKSTFVSLFPSTYGREVLDTLDDDGIVKVGTRVRKGDPLVLRAKQLERAHNKVARGKFGGYSDQSETWDHQDEGTVTDVERTRNGVVVAVKSDHPTREGDKIVIRYGSKGLIGKIVPDHEMPHDQQGRPMEALINPLTVITRRNPAQVAEAVLGKIAKKTGVPYKVAPFYTGNQSIIDFAQNEAQKHGVSDTEDLVDPKTGRVIPNVLTGFNYFLKLHHLAEMKASGRGLGAYGQDDAPSKTGGPVGSAKRFSLADNQAALSHGAHAFIRDTRVVRAQRNDEYWARLMAGQQPAEPNVATHHERFLAMLKAGGLHPIRSGHKIRLTAMTDKAVDEHAGDREVESGETVDWNNGLKPIPGGLFDESNTGGHGNRTTWAKISLPHPIPNPAFEEPIRWVLGVTEKTLRNVLAGREELQGKTGPEAVQSALSKLNVKDEIVKAKKQWETRKGVSRDQAARRWSVLEHAQRQGLTPADWMVSKIPVLPPAYRPVSVMQDSGRPLVHDANALYKDVIDTANALKSLHGRVTDVGDERLAMYDAVKAVVGLGDPVTPKNQERGVKGVLKTVFGSSGPKYSCYDDQTEILTQGGWKLFASVQPGEFVATLHPINHNFEWQPVQAVHVYDHVGVMHDINTPRGLSVSVTGEHRHWAKLRAKAVAMDLSDDWQFVKAAKLQKIKRRVWIKTAASGWKGVVVPPAFLPEPAANMAKFARFVGWWAAEGWIGDSDYAVQMSQAAANKKYWDEIDALFRIFDKHVSVGDYTTSADHGFAKDKPRKFRQWSLSFYPLVKWLLENVSRGASTKKLSREILDWPVDLLQQFLFGYLSGDGGKRVYPRVNNGGVTHKNNSQLLVGYVNSTTTSKELADDLQEIACKLGVTSRIAVNREADTEKNYLKSWRNNFSGSGCVVTEKRDRTTSLYSGKVFCVSVPNAIVFVRKNGKPYFSGNSMQRQLLGSTVDSVGRGSVVPNPELDMDQVGLPEGKAWEVYQPYVVARLVRQGVPGARAYQMVSERDNKAKQALVEEMDNRPTVITRAPVLHKYGELGFRPRLVTGDQIQMPVLVTTGMGMDFDGDAISFHVPTTQEAINDVYTRMMPSKNLHAVRTGKVHQVPKNEFGTGLYQASADRSDSPVRTFETRADAIAAYRRGEISHDQAVRILKD